MTRYIEILSNYTTSKEQLQHPCLSECETCSTKNASNTTK